VGRSREFRSLAACCSGATRDGPSAAIVIAEPGLGKSRLLEELVSALELPVVRLHGYEPAREIPLGAAGGLLRWLATVEEEGPRLAGLLAGEAAATAGLETVRLFETAFRCLEDAGPLAVVVDDLQWVDAETLALLHYLISAARASGLPLLVVCASRPAAEAQALSEGLAALLARDSFLELTLGPLDQDDGVELVLSLAPQLGRADAVGIWQRARGSPFWLAALAAAAGTEATPADLIHARFATLDVDAARLFALLVVAARPLAIVDAAELLAWPQERAGRAADALANRALVLRESESVRMAHDLIREAAERELPEAEESRLHALLADWLEGRAGDDLHLIVGALEHRQAASLPTDELALRVARSPQRRLLGAEGLSLLAEIADGGVDGIALRREVAALAAELGEWAVALERWAAIADRPAGDAERAQATLAAATAALRLGRADEVHAFVARARTLAPEDPVLGIEADFRESQALLWLEGRLEEAAMVVERALSSAERLVERAGGVDELDDQSCGAYVHAVRGKLDAAIRSADADTVGRCAELIQRAARDPTEVLAAASDGVFSLLQLEGFPRPAEPPARRALQDARRLALPSLEVEATHWVGWIAHHQGHLDEASELLQRAVALAERIGPPRRFTVAQLRSMAYSIEASRGDWAANVAAIEHALESEPDPHFRVVIHVLRVWLVGRFAPPGSGALDALLPAMAEDAAAAGCGRCLWESVLHGAEASARIGDVEAAEAALERWDAANPVSRPGPGARRAYAEALLTARRDPAASLALFEQAAKLAEAAGHNLMRLWIDLDTASTLGKVDRAEGIAALRAVAERADIAGAVSEQQLAVQALRTLGVRTWRRSRTAEAHELSPREREIADLVVAGASNPEIAQALFLSRKTVERHVSHILTKLGARNRVELAARLARKGAGAAG
jgi:DNA-binding CsgD family transcriptional regulator/tetratricopeptide (TPR) repeat protein